MFILVEGVVQEMLRTRFVEFVAFLWIFVKQTEGGGDHVVELRIPVPNASKQIQDAR